jgi:hypothetical protein
MGLSAETERVTIRVLPQAVVARGEPFRLGFQAGFLEGPGNPLRAECFSEGNLGAEPHVTVKPIVDPNTGGKLFLVANEGSRPSGVTLMSTLLRKGVGYAVRARCRRVKGSGEVRLRFAPVGKEAKEICGNSVSLEGGLFVDTSFLVRPQVDGAFLCSFQLAPGCTMEFAEFSMLPEDAEAGWDCQSLKALRAVGAGDLRWPVQRGVGFYNWYDGVGPRRLRRAVSPTARAEDGHDFGTVEFVEFCRLIGAQPLVEVTVFPARCSDPRVEELGAAVCLAADWVAYCNATNDHPLAVLRARHGHAAALGVRRWELVTSEGAVPDAAVCRAYAAAMKAEDPSIQVGVSLEGGSAATLEESLRVAGGFLDFVSCDAVGTVEKVAEYNRKNGTRLRVAATRMEGVRDRYVSQVMARLDSGGEAERRYYGTWFDSLSVVYAALERLRQGGGMATCTQLYPEQVLYHVPYARQMLTETGLLLALFNRFPACVPLVSEGAPAEKDSPFLVQAAWTEDDSALVVYVYNSGTEARKIRIDLTMLKRRFAFWMADQLAAEITTRHEAQAVPVCRKQKAGAALRQVIPCDAAPASFTRIVVKE